MSRNYFRIYMVSDDDKLRVSKIKLQQEDFRDSHQHRSG
jgi:hypothetical protein